MRKPSQPRPETLVARFERAHKRHLLKRIEPPEFRAIIEREYQTTRADLLAHLEADHG